MLKYQVRTLGRRNDATSDKRRRSSTNQNSTSYYGTSLRDVFAGERRPISDDGAIFSTNKISDNDQRLKRGDHIILSRSISTASSSTNSSLNSSLTIDDESLDVFSSSASSSINWRNCGNDQASKFSTNGRNSLVNNLRGRSTSVSSLSSSTSTNSEPSVEWGHVRVYTYNIRPDTTYFTLCANTSMTSQELIRRALDRLRMKIKDIDLFYMTMELSSRQKPQQQHGASTAAEATNVPENDNDDSLRDVTNVLALDPHSKPLELQMCHPAGKSKFVIQLRYTFPVKIYDYCLSDTSNYKSLLVSQRTTCSDVIRSILNAHKIRNDQIDSFALVFVDYRSNKEKVLDPFCRLFDICLQIESDHYQQIHIRPCGKFAYLDDDENDGFFADSRNKRQVKTSSPDLSDFDAFVYSRLTNKFREFVL